MYVCVSTLIFPKRELLRPARLSKDLDLRLQTHLHPQLQIYSCTERNARRPGQHPLQLLLRVTQVTVIKKKEHPITLQYRLLCPPQDLFNKRCDNNEQEVFNYISLVTYIQSRNMRLSYHFYVGRLHLSNLDHGEWNYIVQ